MHIYQSKKSQSPLNFRLPQGEEFQLIYILNEFEEEVLGVLVKELSLEHQLLQKFKEELLDLDNEKALLTSELEHAKKRREEFHVLLDRDREKLLAEMKKGFSSVETDIREILWDWLLEERGINKFLPNKTNDGISLGIGGLVEMKFPKGSEEPRVIFEKRVTALKAWTEDSGV